jgi:DNA-binding response OmpR family regulator
MKRILIIEDDQFLTEAYKAKLSHHKTIKIDIARDGNEALEKIEAEKPDAIILDLVMPNLDGFGFLEILKANKNNSNIPVLVASNLGGSEDVKRAMELGAKDYFVKSDASVKDIIDKVTSIMH